MPSFKKKAKEVVQVGKDIHLVEIQWPSIASPCTGSGCHVFLIHLSSPGSLLGARLSAAHPVRPTLDPSAPPHPGICFSCFFSLSY